MKGLNVRIKGGHKTNDRPNMEINWKKIINFEFLKKNIFQANALKAGATSNIVDEFQKNFRKNQRLKNAERFWEYARRGKS